MAIIGSNILLGEDNIRLCGVGTYDTTTMPSNEKIIAASDYVANQKFGQSVSVGCGKIVVGTGQISGWNYGNAAYIYNYDGTGEIKIVDPNIVYGTTNTTAGAFGYNVRINHGRVVVSSHYKTRNGITQVGSILLYDVNGKYITELTDTCALNRGSGDALSAAGQQEFDRLGESISVSNGRIYASINDMSGGLSSYNYRGAISIFTIDGEFIARVRGQNSTAFQYFGSGLSAGCGVVAVAEKYYPGDSTTSSPKGTGRAFILDMYGREITSFSAPDAEVSQFDNKLFGERTAIGNGRILFSGQSLGSSFTSESVYVYTIAGEYITKITNSEVTNFGKSFAVGSGRICIIGDGNLYLYDLNGNYIGTQTTADGAEYTNVDIADGKIVCGSINMSGNGSGAVYIYDTPNIKHVSDYLDKF